MSPTKVEVNRYLPSSMTSLSDKGVKTVREYRDWWNTTGTYIHVCLAVPQAQLKHLFIICLFAPYDVCDSKTPRERRRKLGLLQSARDQAMVDVLVEQFHVAAHRCGAVRAP